MLNREKIDVLKEEFSDKANNLISLINYSKKIEESFLSVKLAFTAFLGAMFAIIVSKIEVFEKSFLVIFLAVIILSFSKLIYELWTLTKDAEDALKKQHERTILAKIRHIASIEEDVSGMADYGKEAEKLLIEGENTRQQMFNKLPIDKIIKYPGNELEWKINFALWTIIFLSVPILFLLKILNIL